MIKSSLLEHVYQCIDLFGQVNQCSSFFETGAVIVTSILGVIIAAFWARRVARRRATLDILLMEETKPEWIERRTKFNILLEKQKGDLDKYATKAQSSKQEAVLLSAVLNQYELVSIGINRRIIDEKSYKDWCRTTLVADWIACKSFVEKLRSYDRHYVCFHEFEKLAKRWAITDEEKPHV